MLNTLQFIFILSFDLSESIVLIKFLCSFKPCDSSISELFIPIFLFMWNEYTSVEPLDPTSAITVLLTSTHYYPVHFLFSVFCAVEMTLPNQENSAGNFNYICNESTPGSRIKCSFIQQVFCFIHLPEDDLNQIILSFRNINWKFCNHNWVDLHNLCSHIFPLLSAQMRRGHTF